MEPIEGVTFIQGDFREAEVLQQLEQAGHARGAVRKVDVVVSDMAPNLSGIESADAARIAHLVELAVEFAQNHMKPDGALVVKVFHGSGYRPAGQAVQGHLQDRQARQAQGLAANSSETFLVGRGLKKPA
jgi:23S rRNA (uridine2552-2'-O)-methyltransferase